MHASLRLGRLAGVEVGINWSWLVILALISASLGFTVFPTSNPGYADGVYAAMAVVAALLFFVSLLLHELGHAVVARREGMEIEGIVLWLFGGVAQFRGLFPSAGAELRIALAGPAVSLFIGLTLLALALLAPLPGFLDGSLMWLGRINLVLLAFNMLPALPLDGGRVFRALVWQRTGDFTRATSIAGAVGRGFGQLMIGGGLLMLLLFGALGGIWLALLGWFLMAAAGAEVRFATLGAALRSMSVADAMASDPITVPAGQTLAEFNQGVFTRSRHAAYPVVDEGRLVGLLGFRDLTRVSPARWGEERVDRHMRTFDRALVMAPGDDLGAAAMDLSQDDIGRALVVEDGRLAGLLSMTDVSRLIELRSRGLGAGSGT
jgi:Zn-dependent protease/CBS domain-containing protein